MAFKFVEKTPEVTRGRSATPAFTEAEVKELQDNPAMWALVKEDTEYPQKYVNWVKKTNGDGADGPWKVRTAAHRNKDGEPHTEQATDDKGKPKVKDGKPVLIRFVDVYVSFDPENKAQ